MSGIKKEMQSLIRKLNAATFALLALLAAPFVAHSMSAPGAFTLGDFTVAAASTQTGTAITGLDGLDAASLQVRLAYGSGGTTIKVYVQTSLDQGQSWFDIANIAFTTSSGVSVVNLSGLSALTTPTVPVSQALADNTVLNGPLGDRLRAVVVSTGTYAGQTLVSVRGIAR